MTNPAPWWQRIHPPGRHKRAPAGRPAAAVREDWRAQPGPPRQPHGTSSKCPQGRTTSAQPVAEHAPAQPPRHERLRAPSSAFESNCAPWMG
eukprot:scaffold15512_cov110-Isochrysis_galbana.AAC.5